MNPTSENDKFTVGSHWIALPGLGRLILDGRKQAVLINIVGNIDPEKLGLLGERTRR